MHKFPADPQVESYLELPATGGTFPVIEFLITVVTIYSCLRTVKMETLVIWVISAFQGADFRV